MTIQQRNSLIIVAAPGWLHTVYAATILRPRVSAIIGDSEGAPLPEWLVTAPDELPMGRGWDADGCHCYRI